MRLSFCCFLFMASCASESYKTTNKVEPQHTCDQIKIASIDILHQLSLQIDSRNKSFSNPIGLSAAQIKRITMGQIKDTKLAIQIAFDIINQGENI